MVSAVGLVAMVGVLTPWGAAEPLSGGGALEAFSADQVARADRFQAQLRPAAYLGLAVGLIVTAALGLTRSGLGVVRSVARRPGRWWLQVPAVVVVVASAVWLVTLPFQLWVEVVLRRWGLSTQDWGGWLLDEAKELGIGMGLTAAGFLVLVGLARWLPRWWFVPAGAAAAVVTVVMSFLYPVVFEPVFNRFEPMADVELRSTLLELAEEDGVPVDEVLVADASRRTTSLNAYVSGFGSTRRIVVYDTLLDEARPDEVASVVAHELGHADEDDVLVGTAIGAVGAVTGVAALYLVLGSRFARRRGVSGAGDPIAAAMVLALASVAALGVSPVEAAVSRQVEARADQHALDLTADPTAMIAMQQRLSTTNLADLDPPLWTYLVFGSHPTAAQRIAMACSWADAHGVDVGSAVEPVDETDR